MCESESYVFNLSFEKRGLSKRNVIDGDGGQVAFHMVDWSGGEEAGVLPAGLRRELLRFDFCKDFIGNARSAGKDSFLFASRSGFVVAGACASRMCGVNLG